MPKAPFISVVDDDRFHRASMRRLVTSLGYAVEDFASAADFLASPRLAGTACLIADIHMPTMTGVELHRHLVDVGHAIPTILVTGRPDDGERARALSDGVVCYLDKPINEEHLVKCLHSALQSDDPQDEDS
jgi:FixJ family two-component response regulator